MRIRIHIRRLELGLPQSGRGRPTTSVTMAGREVGIRPRRPELTGALGATHLPGNRKGDEGRDSAEQGGSDSGDFGMSAGYFVSC